MNMDHAICYSYGTDNKDKNMHSKKTKLRTQMRQWQNEQHIDKIVVAAQQNRRTVCANVLPLTALR